MSLAQQLTGLRCPPISTSALTKRASFFTSSSSRPQSKRSPFIVSAVAISNAQTKERQELKQLFEEAYERCRTAPAEGVSFTLEDFESALDKYDFNSEIGAKVSQLSTPSLLSPFSCFFSF